ncbi:uncharacterized protein LOC105446919 isoform X2 [Strongylocentrotus purpuratus]|uniref:Uncharacterized protein n=1 Tax=Strongylocentrotus purpuratus TaxID=7668 RepID=A0A7M7PVA6_STRPU|nr:uncharacterized protein LOC105446919 isoform X2 [Strongylocentrotus purpuratus]
MQKLLIMSGCNESAFYLQNGEVSELEHHAQDLPVHSILEEESATTASTEMSNGREEDVLHAELSDSDDDPTYYAHESDSSDSSSTSSDRLEGFRRPKKFKKSVKTSSLPRKRAIPSDSRAPVKMKAEQDDTISSSSITVLCANNREKRKWDKRQVCVYCEKFVSKLPRHLESHHQNEAPVQEFLSHPKKTTPRAQLLKILQNEGNHKHNISVLEVQSGSLIPVKRPSGYVDYRDYLPCDECLGWFVSSDMWKHKKTCFVAQKSGRKHGKTLQSRCALMLPMSKSATADLRETVLSRMRYPCPISMAARNDDLICKMGSRVLKQTKASSSTCYQTVSQKMREMARLLRRLREDNSVLTMKDCIDPKMFDNVIDAVRQEAGFNAKTGKYATPSLALKLGHSLSMCATICRAEAIKQEDRITKLKAEDFEDLCKSEWRVEVSKGALQGLEEKRWNAPPAIPMTSEVTKVRQCVFKAIEENKAILQEAQYPSGNTYASLAQAILADIVMFNRRRSGEVQRLKLDDISKAKFGDNNPEIMCCLSQWEQQLCKELTRLEIRGKRGRKVPVLLTKEMSANIKFLSEKRAFAGVKDSNPYLFGIPGCDTSYRGSDCIRKFAQASGVEHPEYITSTKLRKHVATMSQLISLKENELDVLATFMGHDIRTHRHYYRLPEDTLQTAKVAKLLILADRERLTSCAGKSLDAIDLEEPCYETDDQGIDDCDDIQDDGDCGETCQPTDRESTDRESPDRESTDRESTSQLQPMKKDLEICDSYISITPPPPPPPPSPASTLAQHVSNRCSLSSSLQLEETIDSYTPTPPSSLESDYISLCSAQSIPPVDGFPLPDPPPTCYLCRHLQHAPPTSHNYESGSSYSSDSSKPYSLVCFPDSSPPSMPSSMSSSSQPSSLGVCTPTCTCHDYPPHVSVHTSIASFSFPQLAPTQIPPSFCCFLTVSILLLFFMLCLLVLLIILY